MSAKYYVARTDKLGKPRYFAGAVELGMTVAPVLTQIIFEAHQFESEDEFQKFVADFEWAEGAFIASECSSGTSSCLKPISSKNRNRRKS